MVETQATSAPILEVRGIKRHYPFRRLFDRLKHVKALDGVSFSLGAGKTLAVVGESGCGKSTLAKVLTQIEPLTEGEIRIDGRDSSGTSPKQHREAIQMIFQDPYGSLNPRKKAWQIISEPLRINTKLSSEECRKQALALMAQVGLRPEMADRYPHMFSGGQRQRIGIARALALKPRILICDEPVSALDVSIQAQVINLLVEIQNEKNLSYIFISHDLAVVRHLADEVMVMYLGKVVEKGSRSKVFSDPAHPYTRALLSSTPDIHRRKGAKKAVIQGEPPSPFNPPSGCAFHKRCPYAIERCKLETPELREVRGRQTACHLADSLPPPSSSG